MCKNTGRWTNSLYKLASETQRGEYGNAGNDVNVLVEGPYGQFMLLIFNLRELAD